MRRSPRHTSREAGSSARSAKRRRCAGRLDAPQQRAQAREQLAQREGLDQVVVGAGIEAGHAVVDRVARGEHQDRRAVAGLAHAPADLEAVDVRHGDVEDDGVELLGGETVERLAAVLGERHVVALERQRALHRRAQRRLVIDHQDSHCRVQDTSEAVRVGEEQRPATFSGAADAEYRSSRRVQPALRGTMTLSVDIPRDPIAPAAARRAIEGLSGTVADDVMPDVKLLVSELVTNSVKYGGEGALRLQIDTDGPRKLRAEVIDQGVGFVPVARDRPATEVGGWGLHLVQTLSNRWGVHEGSTHVWFEIER